MYRWHVQEYLFLITITIDTITKLISGVIYNKLVALSVSAYKDMCGGRRI